MSLAPPPPPPVPLVVPAPHAERVLPMEKAARVGLVLAVVLMLAGGLGVAVKSADDSGTEAVADAGHDPLAVPDGFHIVQGDGVYLAVPADWVSLTPAELRQRLDARSLGRLFPDVDDDLLDTMQRMLDQGVIFMAMDTSGAGRGNNINMLTVPARASLDLIADAAEGEIRGSGIPVEFHGRRDIETPLGPGLRLSYRIEVLGRTIDAAQYYVPSGRRTYVITGTGDVSASDQAIQTLRLGEAPAPT